MGSSESCKPDEPGEKFTGYPCTGGYWGKPVAHPEWTWYLTIPNTHDVGIVRLDKRVVVSKYGKLAELHYLASLAIRRRLAEVEFTVVGYGLQMVRPHLLAERTRYVATVSLVGLRSALKDGYNIQVHQRPPGNGVGPRGVCFGDSGGPVIHKSESGEEVIVAVNSFVLNENCMGTAFAFRIDTEEARKLLGEYQRSGYSLRHDSLVKSDAVYRLYSCIRFLMHVCMKTITITRRDIPPPSHAEVGGRELQRRDRKVARAGKILLKRFFGCLKDSRVLDEIAEYSKKFRGTAKLRT